MASKIPSKFHQEETDGEQFLNPKTYRAKNIHGDDDARKDSSTRKQDTDGTGAKRSRKLPILITLDGRRINERFVIKKTKSIVGRDLAVDIPISDSEISRRHFYVVWENHTNGIDEFPICKIGDLGSTNGTQVNGQELRGEKFITDGDLIRVGQTMLGFFVKDERVLQLDQLLLQMALLDSLTGMHMREFFFTELHREFQRARRHNRPLAVGMLDIDFFKNVNDRYGHQVGDSVLRQLGEILRDALREGDICGRYGGEEFAILFPETDREGVMKAAERIRKAVDVHHFSGPDGGKIHLTVSIGIACLSSYHTDKSRLLEEADRSLYQAKASGRNQVCMQDSDVISQDNTKLI